MWGDGGWPWHVLEDPDLFMRGRRGLVLALCSRTLIVVGDPLVNERCLESTRTSTVWLPCSFFFLVLEKMLYEISVEALQGALRLKKKIGRFINFTGTDHDEDCGQRPTVELRSSERFSNI